METPQPPALPPPLIVWSWRRTRTADAQELWQPIDDANPTVANTARRRLNLALRPVEPVQIPVIDPKAGLVVKP